MVLWKDNECLGQSMCQTRFFRKAGSERSLLKIIRRQLEFLGHTTRKGQENLTLTGRIEDQEDGKD